MRTVYDGVDDLKTLMPELTPAELARTDFGSYSREQFYEDLGPDNPLPHAIPNWPKHSSKTAPTPCAGCTGTACVFYRFTAVNLSKSMAGSDSGVVSRSKPGEVDLAWWTHSPTAPNAQVSPSATVLARPACCSIRDASPASLTRSADGDDAYHGDAVVLACGGFESSAEWRTRYLGPGWDLARVRGTRFNTGDGIAMALAIGAAPRGHWSGCHAVAWDLNAPEYGDLEVGDGFQKHSYPLGIMVNNQGKRFLDEGADFRNFTYARYGAEILKQPQQTAWQVFDARVASRCCATNIGSARCNPGPGGLTRGAGGAHGRRGCRLLCSRRSVNSMRRDAGCCLRPIRAGRTRHPGTRDCPNPTGPIPSTHHPSKPTR